MTSPRSVPVDPDEPTAAESKKFERFQAKQRAVRRTALGLLPRPRVIENISGRPIGVPRMCTFGDQTVPEDLRCDNSCPKFPRETTLNPFELWMDWTAHRAWDPTPSWREVDYDGSRPLFHELMLIVPPFLDAIDAEEKRIRACDATIESLREQKAVLEREEERQKDLRAGHEVALGAADQRWKDFLAQHSEAWIRAVAVGRQAWVAPRVAEEDLSPADRLRRLYEANRLSQSACSAVNVLLERGVSFDDALEEVRGKEATKGETLMWDLLTGRALPSRY